MIFAYFFIVCVFLLSTGSLPWNGHTSEHHSANQYAQLLALKQSILITTLCAELPSVFATLLRYTREEVRFEARPDYTWCRERLFEVYREKGYDENEVIFVQKLHCL